MIGDAPKVEGAGAPFSGEPVDELSDNLLATVKGKVIDTRAKEQNSAAKQWLKLFLKHGLKGIFSPDIRAVQVPAYFEHVLSRRSVATSQLQKFMVWRAISLLTASIFYIVMVGMQGGTIGATMEKKAAILGSFPSLVKLYAAFFPKSLMYAELAQFAFVVLGAILCIVAFVTWSNYRLSRRLIWMSWLCGFICPFCIMLFYPFRTAVDWQGVATHLCVTTIEASFQSQPDIAILFKKVAETNPRLGSWQREGVTTVAAKDFCTRSASLWSSEWFGGKDKTGQYFEFLQTTIQNCLTKDLAPYVEEKCSMASCTLSECMTNPNLQGSRRLRELLAPVRRLASVDDFLNLIDTCNALSKNQTSCNANAHCYFENSFCNPDPTIPNNFCGNFSTESSCSNNNSECVWYDDWSSCSHPLEQVVAEYQLFTSTLDVGANHAFSYTTFSQAYACEAATGRQCLISYQGDGECQLECFVSECLYDAQDCCEYYGIDCGQTSASRDTVLVPIVQAVKADNYTDPDMDFSENSAEDDAKFASDNGLDPEDMKNTGFDDMAAADQEDFANSPDATEAAISSNSIAMGKSLSKQLKIKSLKGLAETMVSKVELMGRSLANEAKNEAGRILRDFQSSGRRLPEGGRRLSSTLSGDLTLTPAMASSLGAELEASMTTSFKSFTNKKVKPMILQSTALQMLDTLQTMQQISQGAASAFGKAEYLLGSLMGLYSLKALFPLCLGVLSGLTKGIVLVRGLLPATVVGGYIEVLVVFSTIPLFSAYLATLFQVVGVAYTAPAFVLLIMFLAIPGTRVYWYSKITDYQDAAMVGKVNFRIMLVQYIFLLAALLILLFYALGMLGDERQLQFVKELRIKQLLKFDVLVTMIIKMGSLNMVTCIAAADAIFSIEGAIAAHYRKLLEPDRVLLDEVMVDWSQHLVNTPAIDDKVKTRPPPVPMASE